MFLCTLFFVHACDIDLNLVLSVRWHINVQSKHSSFACFQRGGLMKPRLPRVNVFFFYYRRGKGEIER